MNKKAVVKFDNDANIEEIEKMKVYQKLLDSQETYTENKKRKVTLSARIIGYHYNENAKGPDLQCTAMCYYHDWRIMIPAAFMGFEKPEETTNENLKKKYKSYISSMVGGLIDFVVVATDAENRVAIANRVEAMRDKIQRNYITSDESGLSRMERLVRDEKFAQARVITVARSQVFLDIAGKVVRVFAREVAWRYVDSLSDVISVGDFVDCKIKKLEIDKENKKVDMEVSIKEAYPNTIKENMKNYTQGSQYLGKISGISKGYFVQIGNLETGIDVYCKKVNCSEMPEVKDEVLVSLTFFSEEEGKVFGSIEKIIRKGANARMA